MIRQLLAAYGWEEATGGAPLWMTAGLSLLAIVAGFIALGLVVAMVIF